MYLNGCWGCIPSGVSVGFWKTHNTSNPGISTYPAFTFDDVLCHPHIRGDVHPSTREGSAFSSYLESKKTNLNHQRTFLPEIKERNKICETNTEKLISDFGKGETIDVYCNGHVDKLQRTSDLKFGIQKILSEEFGKESEKKGDNTEQKRSERIREHQYKSFCICNSSNCPYTYISSTNPSPTLSVFQTIQPPQYPVGSGTDALPGPYSILSADHISTSQTKRKRSWSRAVFSNLQRKGLEKRFEVQKYVTKPDRRQLAAMLGLTDAQVKVWFQNRRMKWRQIRKSTEKANNSANDEAVAVDDADGEDGDVRVIDSDSELDVSHNDSIVYTSSDEELTSSCQNHDSHPGHALHSEVEHRQQN